MLLILLYSADSQSTILQRNMWEISISSPPDEWVWTRGRVRLHTLLLFGFETVLPFCISCGL